MSARPGAASGCPREDELLAALGRGFVAADLEAHARQCEPCRELRLVVDALLDERAAAIAEAPVPGAGTTWWRLRVRHRREAQAAARRYLLAGQAVSLAVGLALLLWLFGDEAARALRQLVAAVRLSTPLLVALAGLALLVPLGGWIALRQK
jgi:hypothetical protein